MLVLQADAPIGGWSCPCLESEHRWVDPSTTVDAAGSHIVGTRIDIGRVVGTARIDR